MKHTFEQVKNPSRTFINIEDKEEYDKLYNLVTNYDEDGVNNWFNEKKSWLKKKQKNNIAKAIGYSSYYFSVRGSIGMSRKELEELKDKQILILLKHFKLEEQLIILTQNFDMENEKIFQQLYQSAKKEKKKELLYSSRIILDPLMSLFSRHQFTKLKDIESIIEKNMVDLDNPKIAFFHKESSSYIKVKNNYNLVDEIILNYSEEKKEFIISYGRKIPDKKIAYQLLEDINNSYQQKDWLSQADNVTLNQITKNINQYIKAIMYFDLNKKLPEKNVKIHGKKI